ncbi:hypothetical protein BLA29_000173 [Euroglyphus maynei]|uniref:Protein CASC3 n=1 Tax=Euroglyphus maynei TaxID=6958 RepID=A0A1Y3AZD2_EURMA|nr:hypothetical protein BLA29_000173 [Euroglyphus maynei]
MNDNPLSKPTVMEDLTKSNQSTIDDEHNRIEVIDGEDIEFVKLYEKSSIINKNDNNNSDNSDNDRKFFSKPLESEPELRNTSTSNAGESEYESANEEELLFQNNNNNDISNSLTDEQIDEKSNEFIINDYEKNEMSNYYSFVSQKERDDDDDDVVVEEEEELIENIDDANEICENNGSVHDDKHEDMIDNHHQSNNDSNPRECGDGEESIQLENKTVLSDENWNLMNDDSNNNNKDSMINSATTVAPKSLPKSTKLTKAELLKAKRNPQYIPRKGSYFEHDDRGNEEDGTKNNENDQPLNSIGEENEMNDSVDDQKANMATKKKSMFSSMKLCSDEMNDNDHQSMTSQNSDQDQQEGRCLLEKTNNIMESSMTTPSANKKKSIWDSGEKWSHDKFNQEDQRPKTREELINIYGYDIRTETDAPRLNRRSKYGKGPQRYSRRSDDENAYAKKTLRKVIMKSRSSNDHASTSSTSSSINNDHHHMNNNNNLIEKQSSEPNTANKRDRIFDRSLNNDHNSLNNSRNSHQSKSKDMPVTNAKMIKSYRNTGNNSDSNFNSHRYHHQHSDNSSPRIFENDRIFTNKSGGNRSYSNNNNNNMEKTISKTTPSHSNKSSDESGSDIIAQPVTNITPDNSVVGQKDNNNNKQIGKNPMFTNEDFPALMSTSSSSKNNATSASNQSNDDCNNSQESLNKDARNGSKFIYYQLPNSSSESEKSNETKRMTNEDANESVQPATLSESNIGRQAAVQEYNSHYNRQQQQPSSHNAAPVESLQFDNSRYHSSRNNKVTSQTHYYNNSNQSWNNNNPQHRQQSSSKAHHHTYNQNNNTNNTRKYNNNNDESNVLIHHHETNNDDSMTKRYSSLRQQQQRNLNPTAGTGSNVSHHHQPEIDNAAPQYIETDATQRDSFRPQTL